MLELSKKEIVEGYNLIYQRALLQLLVTIGWLMLTMYHVWEIGFTKNFSLQMFREIDHQ